jgi:hypothetical protein
MPAPKNIELPAEFDETVAALLAVKPPPSGKKAVARKKKREAAKPSLSARRVKP